VSADEELRLPRELTMARMIAESTERVRCAYRDAGILNGQERAIVPDQLSALASGIAGPEAKAAAIEYKRVANALLAQLQTAAARAINQMGLPK
jgi:hypothetical protein